MSVVSGYGGCSEFGPGNAALSCAHDELVIGHANNAIAKRIERFDIDLCPPVELLRLHPLFSIDANF
jgi:hypothetical protein